MPNDFSVQKAEPLYEQVYLALRKAVISGEFPPGSRLIETKLAETLQTSRTPVREAIRKLEREGLVNKSPAGGVMVCDLSADDVEELYECRSVLEGLAARLAAGRIKRDELELIEKNLHEVEGYVGSGDTEAVVRLNTQFHDIIIKASRNARLLNLMTDLRTQIVRFRLVTMHLFNRSESFLEEHLAIYQSIAAGSADEAEDRARRHIESDCRTVLLGLRQLGAKT